MEPNYVQKGLECLERARKMDLSSGFSGSSTTHYEMMAWLYFGLGDWDAAQRCAEEGLEWARDHGARDCEGVLNTTLGSALAKADRTQATRGEKFILQGIKILERLRLKAYYAQGYLALGGLYTDDGQKEKALKALRKAKRMFKEMGMERGLARTEKALERLKAS